MLKTNRNKTIIIISLVTLLILSICFFAGFTHVASADTSYNIEQYSLNDELSKKYTDSDYLKDKYGNNLSGKIGNYTDEIKNKQGNDEVSDLTKIIPEKYIRFIEDGYTYQYSGKAYGFFVNHRQFGVNQLVDIVVYDFTYAYNDIYCSVKINLLLQETFQYKDEKWFICNDPDLKKDYYIVNPSFVSAIQNENALNFSDNGYNKKTDKGAIIQSATLNFEGIVLEKDGITSSEGKALIQSAFCGTIENVIGLIPYVGTAYGIISSVNDFLFTLSDSLDYNITTISQGTEGQVLYKSRGTQEEEPANVPFSRASATAPEQEILLTDDDSSYMQCNTNLDNSISRTRIIQCVQFDILQTEHDEPAKGRVFMNDLDDNGKKIPFATYEEKVLFEDQEPKFEVAENNIEGTDIPVYLLPYGKQTITFEPEYSADYKFELSNSVGVDLSVVDFDGNTVEGNGYYTLRDGKKYNIIVVSDNEKVITSLSIGLTDGKNSGVIYAGEKRLVKLDILQSEVYNLSTGNANCLMEGIFVKTDKGLISYSEYSGYTPYSTVSVPLYADEYFILLYNDSVKSCNFNFNSEVCQIAEPDAENNINADGLNYVYIKFELDTGNYTCTIPDAQNYLVLDNDMESIELIRYSNGNFEFENSGNIIYIGILADEGEIDVYLSLSEYSYTWKINGNVVDSNGVELERGNSYTIEFYINGIEQGNDFITYIDKNDKELAEGVNVSGDRLTLMDYCPTGRSFEIKYSLSASAESKSGLTITPKYTVTFNGIESVTNDEKLTFNWKQTGDLAAIYYTLSNGTVTRSGSIDAAGYIPGKIYSEDLTKFSSAFGISYATISIDKIGVTTSKGIDTLNLKTPFTATVHMVYGGGSGTKSNPFTIRCNRHFYNLELNRNRNTYFQMTTNSININGEGIDVFYGYLNYSDFSDNWEVENDRYNITWSADVEVEGIIKENYGTIMNLHLRTRLTDGDRLSSYNAGGIVSENKGAGVIRCCSVELSVSKTVVYSGSIGGIAGINNGDIEYSWVASQVKTVGNYGGIASTNNGTIQSCETTGSIQQEITKSFDYFNNTCVGGIAAINNGTIQSCTVGTDFDSYLHINIVAEKIDNEQLAPYAGPVAGQNNGNISGCTADRYSIDTGNLHSWWAWFHTYDQLKNINNII